MPIRSLQALADEPRKAARSYLHDVTAALRHADAAMRDEIVADLESHLLESLDASATEDDVARLIAQLGSPESFSAALGVSSAKSSTPGAGRVLGIPYDLRMPTSQKIAERLWNPRDPRILMPRIFGMGWDINMGAVAVRLGLIEPDSEDVPFASTPARAFWLAVAVPMDMTLAMLVSFAVLRSSLPAQLPSHWNINGVADGFWDQGSAFGFLFLMAAIPTAWALVSVIVGRVPLLRGAVIGFAALFASLSSLLWLLTLITVYTGFEASWLPPVLIAIAVAIPFGLLLCLARSGRRAEQQRDFSNQSNL